MSPSATAPSNPAPVDNDLAPYWMERLQYDPRPLAVACPTLPSATFAALVLAGALMLAACGAKDTPAGAGPGDGGMAPPPPVGVVTVAPQVVALQSELPGRVEPQRVAQVRSRVNGVVLKRQFTEGSEVKAGQPLFLIDPAPYQAAVDSANAQLARAQAVLDQAAATAERYKPLAEARAISQQDYANAFAAQKSAEADLAAGRAAVQTARINLGYTQVNAPIAGRIGRALVTEGALVSAAEATQLGPLASKEQFETLSTQSGSGTRPRHQCSSADSRSGQGRMARVTQPDSSPRSLMSVKPVSRSAITNCSRCHAPVSPARATWVI